MGRFLIFNELTQLGPAHWLHLSRSCQEIGRYLAAGKLRELLSLVLRRRAMECLSSLVTVEYKSASGIAPPPPKLRNAVAMPSAPEPAVVVVKAHQYKAAALCLADAFHRDDVAHYFLDCPDTANWTPEQKWSLHVDILEYTVYAHCLNGLVLGIPSSPPRGKAGQIDEDAEPTAFDSIALWMPPGAVADDTYTIFRSGMWRLNYQLSREGRARFFDEFMPLLHDTKAKVLGERDDKSWYLVYLGTREAARGRGYARRLIEFVERMVSPRRGARSGPKPLTSLQADRSGLPCYLESSNEINPAIYAKMGFETREKVYLTRAEKPILMDIMVREPQFITKE
jgi:ribosomal protein S18 acetylase RimI-like enzyme